VPMMMGGTRTELLLYMGYFWQEVQGQVNSGLIDYWMSLFYPVNDLQVIKAQPKYQNISSADGDLATEALGIALSDYNPAIGLNNCLYLHTSDTILNGRSVNLPIYQFEFADAAAPVCGVGIAGTCPPFLKNGSPVHSSELNYLFPNLSNTKAINAPDLAPASQALANQMVAYWAKFANSGDPNGNALPTWLPYAGKTTPFGGSSVQLLDTNNNVRPYNSDNQHQCTAFWRGQYSQFLQ
jgi:para-nitrobenzyl esterase